MLKDIEPISNAVVKEYNNEFVEGTSNKLKMIKDKAMDEVNLNYLEQKSYFNHFYQANMQI